MRRVIHGSLAMNILQAVPHYVPAYRFGGPLRVAHALGAALARQGHAVTVCTTNLATMESDLDVPLDRPVELDGVRVNYNPVPFLRRWGFSPALARCLQGEMARADLVLVHAHYQFANLAGAYLARRAGKPYVVFAHSSLRYEAIATKNTWAKRSYLALLERQNMRQALFLAYNAPEEQEASLFQENGRVILNGIDERELAAAPARGTFRAGRPAIQDQTLFLFLGRLDVSQKGLDLLLPAFARLHHELPNTHLILAGPDEDGGLLLLQRLAEQLGVGDGVTFTGLVSGSQKLAILGDADVFVLPSRFEGGSVALLEALYAGLPVLVSDRVGMWRDIADARAGLTVSPDIEAIYKGLRALAQTETRQALRGQGTAMVRRAYTWDRIAAQLMTEVEQCLAPGEDNVS